MIFQLPPTMPADFPEELERASVAGGQDGMPYPTQVVVEDRHLILHRQVEESGSVVSPWDVNGAGRLMVTSGTLMERLTPYQLAVELARGKINQVRHEEFGWRSGGLLMSDSLTQAIRDTTRAFSHAVTHVPDPKADAEALAALAQSFKAADGLVQAYMNQVFQVRHSRQPRLDTSLACRLYPGPRTAEAESALLQSFNAVALPFTWADIEPEEEQYQWDAWDDLANWALANGLNVIGGPLIDFTGRGLPSWLWDKQADPPSLCGTLLDFVERVIERYHTRIRTWQVTAASNWAGVLALSDDELLWMTVKLAEMVRKMDPSLEVIVGISQPWGDYLAHQERNKSPFGFTDDLVRTGVKLAALDIEILMGVAPRGSYCRDLLDLSRLLDLYALLGAPLQVTLAYPSAVGPDPLANAEERLGAGHWRGGYSPQVQAEWAAAFAGLCACKPYVRAVHWSHLSDALPHDLPHCGLIDAAGMPKPALQALGALRAQHLK